MSSSSTFRFNDLAVNSTPTIIKNVSALEAVSDRRSDSTPLHAYCERSERDNNIISAPTVPKAFFCPLTLDVMFNPVLDLEGNSYERSALTHWLQTNETSPISRQPLSEDMLTPNIALRETIHAFMGSKWVEQKEQEENERWPAGLLHFEIMERRSTNATKTEHSVKLQANGDGSSAGRFTRCHRATVDLFLEYMYYKYGGIRLVLNVEGYCAFRFHNFFVVLHVPENIGVLCLYTRHLFSLDRITDRFMDTILQMNVLQASVRGGCLSMKQCIGEIVPEVIFSYTDRVALVSAQQFANVVMNFLQTAEQIRSDLSHFQCFLEEEEDDADEAAGR